ncbi:PAS domain-containing sensor histidine kinase [Melioribacter roseus]|uniref:PAS domain-containing sensor histidine kinase n=1 Tax=Melioribacter roseus TaxID=1134405 RepID=UPI0009D9E9C6|nr:PAS domain S-box protein [Melioribacter roseus]
MSGCAVQKSRKIENIETKLKQHEKRTRLLLKTLCGISYQFDIVENRLVYFEGESIKITGYPARDFISGKIKWNELLCPQDKEIFTEEAEKLRTRKKHTADRIYRIKHKNGSVRWIRDIAEITVFGNHKVINGILYDVTEQIKLKNNLIKAEFSYRSAIDNSPNIIFTVGKNLRFTYLNHAAQAVFGNAEETKSKKATDFILPPIIIEGKEYGKSYMKKIVSEVFEGRTFSDIELKYKSGVKGELITVTRIYPEFTHDKKTYACVFASTDITDRKKQEEKLRAIEKSIEFSHDPIFWVNSKGNIIYANESACRKLGYSKNELLSMSVFDIDPHLKRKEWKEHWKKSINKKYYTFETQHKNRKGEIIPVEISVTSFEYKGETIHSDFARDISDRKKYEIELIKAKEKAEHSEKLKSAFLAQMSHEIRSPLHRILGYVSILKDFIAENLPEKTNQTDEYFHGVELASNRLIRTIDSILNMSELQTRSYEPVFKKFDLNDRLILLYNEYHNFARVKNLEFKLERKTKETQITGDDYSIVQIFANLIDNAIKYTEKGGVKIVIGRNKNRRLFVEVSDTGIGISDEFREELFKPFMQEEHGYTRKYEGSGLGLALVKNYCRINKAAITVKSGKNKGSVFRVTFKGGDYLVDLDTT